MAAPFFLLHFALCCVKLLKNLASRLGREGRGDNMETQYFKDYSPALGREMECKVYGHAGRPVLFIPCQDGRFFDFENFKMKWVKMAHLIFTFTSSQKVQQDLAH